MLEQDKSKTITKTSISGLYVVTRPTFVDERGFFHEVMRVGDIEEFGDFKFHIVQVSHSFSKPQVIRAIHTEGWNKLIYPVTGVMFAAIADVRPDSKTFGKVETFIFDNTKDDSDHKALMLPAGIGNSICVVGNEAVHYIYAVDEYWDNTKAKGIAWDDPDLAIDWPIKDPIISDRDKVNPTLRQLYPENFK